jgi:hypothetical protein
VEGATTDNLLYPRAFSDLFCRDDVPGWLVGVVLGEQPDTTRLVDVPTRVQVPPRMVACESGMRSCCLGTPILLAQRIVKGIITTTMG